MKSLFFILFSFSFVVAFSQEQASFYFNTGKSVLEKTEQDKLDKWLQTNKDSKVLGIYGFCDQEGANSLNDTLAKQRVEFVQGKLQGKIKFREDFKTRTFGELHTTSNIKAENRRVTLYYIQQKDFEREEEIVTKENTKEEKEQALVVAVPENIPEAKIKYPKNLVTENEDGTEDVVVLDTVFMKKLYHAKAGEKLRLKDLNFYMDKSEIKPSSMPKLFELLFVMEVNPKLHIQIQGHLCCVSNDVSNLSTKRARVVYKFLEDNGIDKGRISYIGFGSKQRIYRIPEKSEEQQRANRRVEVMIVKNN